VKYTFRDIRASAAAGLIDKSYAVIVEQPLAHVENYAPKIISQNIFVLNIYIFPNTFIPKNTFF
jgi:hypothetical protein